MAANNNPVFALKPETPVAKITAATTDKSGATTTNIVTLLTAATDGTKVTRIKFKHEGTSTAGIALIWITDTGGTVLHLAYEQTYTAITTTNTTATAETEFLFNDLQLKAGQQIRVGATTANTPIHVTGSLGDLS
jgi:hypothetical protein